MQHLHLRQLGGQAVGDLTGAVGRGIVDHEHVVFLRGGGELRQHGAHEGLHVGGLVVGGKDEPGARHGGVE
jgi:hypothetical protein